VAHQEQMLIAIIGPEGIRKTTLLNGLVSELALCGYSVGMARCEIAGCVDAREWIS
jgi:nucleoside-triphosphatase THEP1